MSRRKLSIERRKELYLFTLLVLWLPITLCSWFLADGGQGQITRAVIPAALLHIIGKTQTEREKTAGKYIQTESG